MQEMIKMVVVLTVLSALSGGMLSKLEEITKDPIEQQILINEKAPTLELIFTNTSNNPVEDRFRIMDGDRERMIYVARYDDKPKAIAFDTSGRGYDGIIGMIVGVNIDDDTIVGVGVTTHSETPGIGARAKTDKAFPAQFKGIPMIQQFSIKSDGGDIDALSGATVTSRGVAEAVSNAATIYERIKPQILEELNKR